MFGLFNWILNELIFNSKLKELLSTPDEWDFDNDNESNETKNAFKKLLDDFRPDTPPFIIDLFKKCVKQNRDARPNFQKVNYVWFLDYCKNYDFVPFF